jgi:LPXTG-site transpeptidase (sortase) family protein
MKMRFMKLACAALFFIVVVEVGALAHSSPLGTTTVPHVQAQAESEATIETAALGDAVMMANTMVAATPERLPEPTKNILVQGKPYLYNLVIPTIGVNVGVHAMGLTAEGKMAVPDNYTEVGWYRFGYRPGEKGSAVMGAHVDNGGKINGVFKHLKNVSVGDKMYVGDGDGNVYVYKVTERKVYDYKTAVTNDVFLRKDAKRLNLITCYGTWLPKENTYNQRLVVFAELIAPLSP